jgi:hypothetical protein
MCIINWIWKGYESFGYDLEGYEPFGCEFVLCPINVFSKIYPREACELCIGFSYEL